MGPKSMKETISPEDVRPVLQSFLQAQLIYKGLLLDTRNLLTKHLAEATSDKAKKHLSLIFQDLKKELKRIDLAIPIKEESIKKGRLRLLD